MGRLYWKFFFAFVLVIVVVGLVVGTTVWYHQRQRETIANDIAIGPRPAILVNAAATTLRHGGLTALREMLGDWERFGSGRPPVLAVADDGSELLGRTVPEAALARARAMSASEAREQRRPAVVRTVTTAEGRRWLLFIASPPDAEPPPPARPRGPPWTLFLAALLASVVASALLAWYMAKPIRLLRSGFTAVAQGDLDTRLQARMGGRRDEIADLGRDFDHMVSRLQAVLAAQRQAASLDRIEREAGRLDELVGEVLALSRLQTERPGEALERADLNELVRAIADDARFEAQAGQRDVTLETGAPLAMPVRRELLQRALENVIRNAVKFTAPGTCVEVRVARDGDQAVIDVDDRGPGVADDELQAIFEPFHRGRHTEGVAGFGLGLAIAQRAVQAHRGQIVAQARADGGLRMRITLPLS